MADYGGQAPRTQASRARRGLVVLGALTAVLWGIQIVNVSTGRELNFLLGNIPRTLYGLDGIIFSPLLHADFSHLLSNNLPLVVLGFLVFLEGVRRFVAVLASSWLVSGVGVWLTGAGLTVGSSGLVFGFLTYLLVRGFYNRSWKQILLAVVIFMFYGSVLWGVLPTPGSGISWQAHLFGAVGGVLAAVLLRKDSRRRNRRVGS
ncbi:rhomboid family intramembrane serine protease [Arthrobacter crystallopoietes]|uniref:Rhomboid family protein n=1 Tax=Crystallibacter crystallopoietes TaxID=37928 RepID=A0A1H1A147_9MICC|nr:rhomboid family intramembrane serine protease [Arthrobacter crystallopoietes]AUI51724.1 rhomboid family intramembrane serine protease [Arthrobacter crystallopoietes]SDQ33447.1 Rhomboid family protein [Arthrobacter crystallopoietes]